MLLARQYGRCPPGVFTENRFWPRWSLQSQSCQSAEQLAKGAAVFEVALGVDDSKAAAVSGAVGDTKIGFAFLDLFQGAREHYFAVTVQFVLPADQARFGKPMPQFSDDFRSRRQFDQQIARACGDLRGFDLFQLPCCGSFPDFSEREVADRGGMKNGIDLRACQRLEFVAQTCCRCECVYCGGFAFPV